MLQTLYRGLTEMSGPAIRLYLAWRLKAGKEDPHRQPERRGVASRPRPAGRLVWFHAASVGEALSILVLIERLLADDAGLAVLVTTGTVSSARLMAERLPSRAIHQYVPVDRPAWVRRFLGHWRPDAAVWIESEIWPNLLSEIGRRHIPAALVNARMSQRSFRRWSRAPRSIRRLLAPFRLCLAQTLAEAERLSRLGAADVRCVGNLKYSAAPLPADPAGLAALRGSIGDRPVWLFASSHPGEDEIAATVHGALKDVLPGLLTLIVPRHPQRGGAIAAMLAERGCRAVLRGSGALPDPATDVYVGDTMGELGLFYRAAPIVCVGGSLVPHGGHNPIEPAQLGCAVLYGPHMTNFAEMTATLEAAGAARPVEDAAELAATVGRLLRDPAARDGLADAARQVAASNACVVDAVLDALRPVLGLSAAAVAPERRPSPAPPSLPPPAP